MSTPQEVWEYEHQYYGPYKPDPQDEWMPLPPRVEQQKIPELIAQMVDTTQLETEYALMDFYVSYGILDDLIEKASAGPKAKMQSMAQDYKRIGEELKKLHEQNHNIALAVGEGLVNKTGTAHASPLGISHSNPQGQHGYHHAVTHGPIHGQPGMPYQQYQPAPQPPSLGKQILGLGLGTVGIRLPQQQQQPPGYPPQYYQPPPQY